MFVHISPARLSMIRNRDVAGIVEVITPHERIVSK